MSATGTIIGMTPEHGFDGVVSRAGHAKARYVAARENGQPLSEMELRDWLAAATQCGYVYPAELIDAAKAECAGIPHPTLRRRGHDGAGTLAVDLGPVT